MAHNLNIENGQASFMFVGEPAWHGLGTRVESAATSIEAIKAANLDWEVRKVPLFAAADGKSVRIKNKFAVVRSDTWESADCDTLGIVGDTYTPLQNSAAFTFFDEIVQKEKAAIYHTAGAIGNGERVWILAKLPQDMRVIGDDITEKFLLLSNSHDGSSSVQIRFTPIRVVCQNTLTMALQESGNMLRVPHVRDLHYRLRSTKEMLGIINTRFEDIESNFKTMTKVDIDKERLDEYLSAVFPYPADQRNEVGRDRVDKYRSFAQTHFESGRGTEISGVKDTLWAAYNGVTEFIDYREPMLNKGRGNYASSKVNNIWFGDGYLTKARAYKIAKEKMKHWLN